MSHTLIQPVTRKSHTFITTIAFEVDGLILRPAYEVLKREIPFSYAVLVHFPVGPLHTKEKSQTLKSFAVDL